MLNGHPEDSEEEEEEEEEGGHRKLSKRSRIQSSAVFEMLERLTARLDPCSGSASAKSSLAPSRESSRRTSRADSGFWDPDGGDSGEIQFGSTQTCPSFSASRPRIVVTSPRTPMYAEAVLHPASPVRGLPVFQPQERANPIGGSHFRRGRSQDAEDTGNLGGSPTGDEHRVCFECGNVLMSDSAFCRKCGQKAEESPAVTQSATLLGGSPRSRPGHARSWEEPPACIQTTGRFAGSPDSRTGHASSSEEPPHAWSAGRRRGSGSGHGLGDACVAEERAGELEDELARTRAMLQERDGELERTRDEIIRLRQLLAEAKAASPQDIKEARGNNQGQNNSEQVRELRELVELQEAELREHRDVTTLGERLRAREREAEVLRLALGTLERENRALRGSGSSRPAGDGPGVVAEAPSGARSPRLAPPCVLSPRVPAAAAGPPSQPRPSLDGKTIPASGTEEEHILELWNSELRSLLIDQQQELTQLHTESRGEKLEAIRQRDLRERPWNPRVIPPAPAPRPAPLRAAAARPPGERATLPAQLPSGTPTALALSSPSPPCFGLPTSPTPSARPATPPVPVSPGAPGPALTTAVSRGQSPRTFRIPMSPRSPWAPFDFSQRPG